MSRSFLVLSIAVLAGIAITLPVTAWAQDDNAAIAEQSATGAAILRGAAQAGLGGPQSVGAQLEEDAAQRKTMSRRPGVDAVYTENLNPDVVVMESAEDRVRPDVSDPLSGARDRRIFI